MLPAQAPQPVMSYVVRPAGDATSPSAPSAPRFVATTPNVASRCGHGAGSSRRRHVHATGRVAELLLRRPRGARASHRAACCRMPWRNARGARPRGGGATAAPLRTWSARARSSRRRHPGRRHHGARRFGTCFTTSATDQVYAAAGWHRRPPAIDSAARASRPIRRARIVQRARFAFENIPVRIWRYGGDRAAPLLMLSPRC